MGTDIHGRLQHRWSKDDPYRDAGGIEDDRSYAVFACLAGVRNGCGFAGVPTHTPIQPISEPRGLPEDFEVIDGEYWKGAPKVDGEFDRSFWMGDHSHSWLTLSEMLSYDWDAGVERVGIVGIEAYRAMRAAGEDSPRMWSGGVSGPGVTIADASEVDAGASPSHVRIKWAEPIVSPEHQFRRWLNYLQSKYGWQLERDPAAVRMVFGFDS